MTEPAEDDDAEGDDGPGFLSTFLLLGLVAGGGWFIWKTLSGSAAGLTLIPSQSPTSMSAETDTAPPAAASNPAAPYLQTIADSPTMTAGYHAYGGLAASAAAAAGVPTDIFLSLVTHESAWNPNAVGAAGDTGLAQVLPATAANPGYGVEPFNPADPVQNLYGAARYLGALFNVTGSWRQALAAYNAGVGGQHGDKGQAYASDVLAGAALA